MGKLAKILCQFLKIPHQEKICYFSPTRGNPEVMTTFVLSFFGTNPTKILLPWIPMTTISIVNHIKIMATRRKEYRYDYVF